MDWAIAGAATAVVAPAAATPFRKALRLFSDVIKRSPCSPRSAACALPRITADPARSRSELRGRIRTSVRRSALSGKRLPASGPVTREEVRTLDTSPYGERPRHFIPALGSLYERFADVAWLLL